MSSSVTLVKTLLEPLLGVFCEDPCHYFRTVDSNVHWKCVGPRPEGVYDGEVSNTPRT